MRRRNWIFAVILSAGMLLAMAQAVWAEPDPAPEDPAPDTTTTTTQPRSTYAWEAETDEFGVTLYPPPPDANTPPDDGPTTTTVKTSRTSAPFQINPDHPDDVFTGALPNGYLPNFNVPATDSYGNKLTVVFTAPPTEETSEEPATDEGEFTEETFPEEPAIPTKPLNWTVVAAAGGILAAAAVGGIIVLARNKKDSDDDFIYVEKQTEDPPEE